MARVGHRLAFVMSDQADLIMSRLSPLAYKLGRDRVNQRFPAGWDAAQTIPISGRFYARARRTHPLPPLAEMVLTGKGAATPRLRTYLWLHLLAGPGGDPVREETASWIRILNLLPSTTRSTDRIDSVVERNAQRRFYRALTHSIEGGWIDRPRRGVLRLRDPWTGGLWRPPSPEEHRKYMAERRSVLQGWGHNLVHTRDWFEADPVGLPIGCFAHGAIGVLTGGGLATLIILLDIGAQHDWQSMPHKRAVRYGLGYKPWHAGVAELHRLGWLDLKQQHAAGAVRVDHYFLRISRIRGDSHLKHGWAPAWD